MIPRLWALQRRSIFSGDPVQLRACVDMFAVGRVACGPDRPSGPRKTITSTESLCPVIHWSAGVGKFERAFT
jgi:hypothetical protein